MLLIVLVMVSSSASMTRSLPDGLSGGLEPSGGLPRRSTGTIFPLRLSSCRCDLSGADVWADRLELPSSTCEGTCEIADSRLSAGKLCAIGQIGQALPRGSGKPSFSQNSQKGHWPLGLDERPWSSLALFVLSYRDLFSRARRFSFLLSLLYLANS